LSLISFSVPWKHPYHEIHDKLGNLFARKKLLPIKARYCPESQAIKYVAWDGCPCPEGAEPTPQRLVEQPCGKWTLEPVEPECCSDGLPPMPCEPTPQCNPYRGIFG
jgi:hypothetical protein